MTFNFDKKLSFGLALYGTSALVGALIFAVASKKSLSEKTKNLNLTVYRLSKVVEGLLEDKEDNNKKNK